LHLLVVGREQSSSQKPVRHYQDLSVRSGVADRCHWLNRFVKNQEVSQYFLAADFILLLYSSAFKSASGVLNNAAQFNCRVLGSSGGGPLKGLVEKYNLGHWAMPDCFESTCTGLKQLLQETSVVPNWGGYRRDHSWKTNATLIIDGLRGT